MDWRRGILFAFWIGIGAFGGSLMAPLLPPSAFRWILAFTCPMILWVVFSRDLWIKNESSSHRASPPLRGIIASGLICGVYDGVWGPGGGTFMLLSLLFFVRLPLVTAIAASKLANTCSAGVALVSYSAQGYVHWKEGLFISVGICIGAWVGAHFANQNTTRVVRPVLACVAGLLALKLIF